MTGMALGVTLWALLRNPRGAGQDSPSSSRAVCRCAETFQTRFCRFLESKGKL